MNPITLNSRYELIAGERRLQSAIQLGWTSINANIIDNLSEIDQLEMEIEENNQRKEFTDAELLEGYKRLNRLRNPNFFYKIYLLQLSSFQREIPYCENAQNKTRNFVNFFRSLTPLHPQFPASVPAFFQQKQHGNGCGIPSPHPKRPE